MDSTIALTGRLVTLRAFTPQDVTDRYVGWLSDPVVTRFSNQRFRRHDRVSSLAYLQSFEGTPNLFLAMDRQDDGEMIGTMTAYFSPPHGTVDIGIMVGEASAWGRGYGQDAWDTLMQWLMLRPEIRKITGGTASPNVGMQRIMERSGMTLEARRVDQEIIDGKAEDILYYARFPIR